MLKSFASLLVSALAVTAFTSPAPFPASRCPTRAESQLFVSAPLPPHQQDEDTPATVFGRPLNDDVKKINKKAVYLIKQIIFDNLFADKSVERAYARFWALENSTFKKAQFADLDFDTFSHQVLCFLKI
jgi:hypothetical protein